MIGFPKHALLSQTYLTFLVVVLESESQGSGYYNECLDERVVANAAALCPNEGAFHKGQKNSPYIINALRRRSERSIDELSICEVVLHLLSPPKSDMYHYVAGFISIHMTCMYPLQL